MELQGKQIYLKKGLVEDNYPSLLDWFHDAEVMGYIGWVKRGLALKNIGELKAFIDELEDGIIFGIYDYENKFIGYTSLSDFKGRRECEFGIFILDRNFWGRGIGKQVTKLMLDYAFSELGMSKVVLSTSELHKKAISLYEKCGFKVSRIIPSDRTILHKEKWITCGTIEMEIKKSAWDNDIDNHGNVT